MSRLKDKQRQDKASLDARRSSYQQQDSYSANPQGWYPSCSPSGYPRESEAGYSSGSQTAYSSSSYGDPATYGASRSYEAVHSQSPYSYPQNGAENPYQGYAGQQDGYGRYR